MRPAVAAAAVAALALGAAWLVAADPPSDWQLAVAARVELAPGTPATIQIDVVPASGRTVSRDGPLRLDVKPPDGLTVSRRRLSLADAVDPAASSPRFSVKLSSDRPGTYPLDLSLRFWLCARQSCKPVRTTTTVTVDVVAPPSPDAAPDAAPPIDAPKKRPPRK